MTLTNEECEKVDTFSKKRKREMEAEVDGIEEANEVNEEERSGTRSCVFF